MSAIPRASSLLRCPGVIAQLLMTEALEHITGATMGIIHQLTVVVAMVSGVLFMGERLSTLSLLGSVVTVAGVAWTVLVSSRTEPAPPTGA